MTNATIRSLDRIIPGTPATDGAGVRLTRIIGTPELGEWDPFLLLDEFRSENPDDYIAGFPAHPHRGFETVTYLKQGRFRHRDSKGNEGLLVPGSVQWMTAGRGIIHSEMPEMQDGLLWGYQLWLNLPAKDKFAEPRYQDIGPDKIPVVEEGGTKVTIIAGEYGRQKGPTRPWISTIYFDVQLAPGTTFLHPVSTDMNGFAYVYEGQGQWGSDDDLRSGAAGQLLVLGEGDSVQVEAGDGGVQFLLIAATRLDEPIVRSGPFVMNTREQLYQAFADYEQGVLDK